MTGNPRQNHTDSSLTFFLLPLIWNGMGVFRRVIELPASTKVGLTIAGLAVSLGTSGVGEYAGNRILIAVGWLLFPWAAGGLLLSASTYFLLSGRIIISEESRRGVAWFFLSFVGWSFVHMYLNIVPDSLLVYFLLVLGTTVVAIALMTVLRYTTDFELEPTNTVPSKRQILIRSLPLIVLFGVLYVVGDWTWKTTIGLLLAVAILLIVSYRPTWIPGITSEMRERSR